MVESKMHVYWIKTRFFPENRPFQKETTSISGSGRAKFGHPPCLTCSMRLAGFALVSTTRVAFVDLANGGLILGEKKGQAMNEHQKTTAPFNQKPLVLKGLDIFGSVLGYSYWAFVCKNYLRASKQDRK